MWKPRSLFGSLMKRNAHAIALGAHRGMGKNVHHKATSRSWRENTIKSFLKAAEHGASFIEFDVQVTKDGVPIVFHDDYITYGTSEYRHSVQIRDLMFDEFRSIGHHLVQVPLQERKALFRESGNETNEWKCEDEDELPSLEEVFRHLPDHVGFNIEIKAPAKPTQISIPSEEIEFVTSAVLKVVDLLKKERTIVFSSFDPDIVQRLKKTESHATMFLSEGDPEAHMDPRCSSFAAAMQWAHLNGLDGVVLHSNLLRHQREVIEEASALGLMVMTYGTDNDDHDWVLSQFCLGVHGAIVDDVAGIAQKLSGS